jgi:hypothetical protein
MNLLNDFKAHYRAHKDIKRCTKRTGVRFKEPNNIKNIMGKFNASMFTPRRVMDALPIRTILYLEGYVYSIEEKIRLLEIVRTLDSRWIEG